jgi:ATP-binding cassette subfamily C protein
MLQLLTNGAATPTEGFALQIHSIANKWGLTLNIETILLTYALLLTFTALLKYYKAMLDASYQQTFIYGFRKRLFRKIILADWQLLNNKSKTNHLQVLTKEVPNLAMYVYYYLALLTTLLTAATYIFYALLVSVKFTLITLVAGILIFILLRKFLFKAFHLGAGMVDSYNHLLKYIDDFWLTVKIAKVHSSEAFYYKKFESANASLLGLELKMQKNNLLPQLIYSVIGVAVLVLVVYTGYTSGNVPLASFFILILLFSRMFPLFVSVNSNINSILSNVASVQLVLNLDAEFADNNFHEPVELHHINLANEIRLEKINFAYPGGKQLFKDYSEIIPAKKITGIVGESGRGKTTLIDLIAGLQKSTTGKILVDGKEIDNDLLPYWKSSIGYLPQDAFFIDGSFRENLVWDSGSQISDNEIFDVLQRVNAAHLVTRFKKGLDEYIVNYHFIFSGGECQRLALARVLLRKPQLLLLDEATSSLDADNEKQIMKVIEALKSRITIILVTHRHSILPWFDKVISI